MNNEERVAAEPKRLVSAAPVAERIHDLEQRVVLWRKRAVVAERELAQAETREDALRAALKEVL